MHWSPVRNVPLKGRLTSRRECAVDLGNALLVRDPEGGVLLRAQLVYRPALLLDPRVVLLVVPAAPRLARAFLHPIGLLAAEDRQPPARLVVVHRTALLAEPAQHRRVAVEAVGGDGDDGLARAQAEVPRRLDRGQDVAHAADAEQAGPAARQVLGYPLLGQRGRSFLQELDRKSV